MMLDVALFAQLEGLNPLNSTAPVSKSSGLVVKDMLLIVGVCLVLAFILFAGARFYIRNKQQQRRRGHRSHKPTLDGSPEAPAAESPRDERGRHRHRRRRRVRDHRPRNPTLAETGGLPPQKSPPSSQQAP